MIQDFYEDLIVVEKQGVRDEFGAIEFQYVDLKAFKGAYVVNNSSQFIIGGKFGNNAVITIVCGGKLEFNTFIKRLKDNTICKVVSKKEDYVAPMKAEMMNGMNYYICEKVVIDNDK